MKIISLDGVWFEKRRRDFYIHFQFLKTHHCLVFIFNILKFRFEKKNEYIFSAKNG